ncbi:sialate O-acetylesterase-like [Hydractinia symbiolongicarpus]|uniref:sialate O-acetylesterase-like n=1 Tax=Hydractinia symbiolongicarpus TaxID=13093 RepID=UPI00254FF66A|nr:sialate O-acetylesterase-like [Hydractinia symbiolongicarpus]
MQTYSTPYKKRNNMFFSLIFSTAVLLSSIECGKFRFANHYADHMVLQRAPYRAVLWGFGENNTFVSISITYQKQIEVLHTEVKLDSRGLYTWKVILPPYDAGGPYDIEALSVVENQAVSITLRDVLFGDVWLCGGQSNMVFTVGMANSGKEEIDMAEQYPNIRLFTVKRYFSNVTVPELSRENILQQWSVASNASVGGAAWQYFSAICWMYGRRLYDLYKIPIGLISSNYGGTRVEAWSSPQTLAVCGISKNDQNALSELYNAMIYPLMNTTIYGAIWYQGEHNCIKPNIHNYNCTFPAMISGWRKEWYSATHGNTNQLFPFGFVQLASLGSDADRPGFPIIRWKQTAEYGYVPNPKQPKVFMAVALDLPDNSSPFGSIHPRDKTDVADRLILGAREIAYNEKTYWTGPIADKIIVPKIYSESVNVSVTYKMSSLQPMGIEVRNKTGFQVALDHSETWQDAVIISYEIDRLILSVNSISTSEITGIRYLWSLDPCLLKKCAVYAYGTDLPSPPFVKYAPFE